MRSADSYGDRYLLSLRYGLWFLNKGPARRYTRGDSRYTQRDSRYTHRDSWYTRGIRIAST